MLWHERRGHAMRRWYRSTRPGRALRDGGAGNPQCETATTRRSNAAISTDAWVRRQARSDEAPEFVRHQRRSHAGYASQGPVLLGVLRPSVDYAVPKVCHHDRRNAARSPAMPGIPPRFSLSAGDLRRVVRRPARRTGRSDRLHLSPADCPKVRAARFLAEALSLRPSLKRQDRSRIGLADVLAIESRCRGGAEGRSDGA